MIGRGTRVGDLELLAFLGRGGQGELFLARPWEPRAHRRAAARLWLRACLAAHAIGPADALRWRLAALKLAYPAATPGLHDEHAHLAAPGNSHPHLASLYGRRYPGLAPDFGFTALGMAGRRAYLALAYQPGRSLNRLLPLRRAARRIGWSLEVARQVAQALAHLHRRGIVHHDVRAANVIVRSRSDGAPHCTLIDLGSAETPAAPRRRAVYGTVGHLPPERICDPPAPASPLVDIFGLGVLLQALTAGLPVSPALATLIADATAPNPVQRAAALPDMDALLARLCLEQGTGDRGQGRAQRAPSPL